MNTEQQMVKDFHTKFGCDVAEHPNPVGVDDALLLLRSRLILDETAEFVTAASKHDFVEMIDALCDLLYVVYGTAVVLGVDLEPVFAEVQRSNMTKTGGGKDAGGKVLKGENFEEPDIIGELTLQGWDA